MTLSLLSRMKKQNIADLATFLEEDLGRGDVTSESLFPKTREKQILPVS